MIHVRKYRVSKIDTNGEELVKRLSIKYLLSTR